MPTLLDLFSGGGLITQGAINAGYQIVGAVERDEAIAQVYADNFGNQN